MAQTGGFSGKSQQRIARVVRQAERAPRDLVPVEEGRRTGGGGGAIVRLAKVTGGAIAAGGSGQVTFYTTNTGASLGTETATATNPAELVSAPANARCWVVQYGGTTAIMGWYC